MSQAENKAAAQLKDFAAREKKNHETLTTTSGCPVAEKLVSLTAGPRGPLLLQDVTYLDEIGHFDRERIPERVVHAKGAAAFGYFEVTNDISKYTKACVFEKIGKRTPMAARFSTVSLESGSADTVRDPRGFALKFYTEDGIWDLVGLNSPLFFIRDPLLFPSFIHILKRNPVTHLRDANMFWDFLSLRAESTHQLMYLFGDRGIPDGFRHMNGYGSNTFKLVNASGTAYYCKFHFKTDQGIRNLTSARAVELAGISPDYAVQDLYNAIANGNAPSWTLYLQTMTLDEAEACAFNPFDATKVWPHADYPLHKVGHMVLNRNPSNYFAEVEQLAFNVSHLIPGIEASPDKILQGRLLSYADTQRHRLGANYMQIPVNCPFKVRNYQADGFMCVNNNQADAPNYFPNSFCGPQAAGGAHYAEQPFECRGEVMRFDDAQDDNFGQAKAFWRKVLDDGARARLVENLTQHVKGADEFIQQRVIENFSQVAVDLGQLLSERLDQLNNENFLKQKYFKESEDSDE